MKISRPANYESASSYLRNLILWLLSLAPDRTAPVITLDLGDYRAVIKQTGESTRVLFTRGGVYAPYGVYGITQAILYRNSDVHLLFGTRAPIDDHIGYTPRGLIETGIRV